MFSCFSKNVFLNAFRLYLCLVVLVRMIYVFFLGYMDV